jgi:hypothetical protein
MDGRGGRASLPKRRSGRYAPAFLRRFPPFLCAKRGQEGARRGSRVIKGLNPLAGAGAILKRETVPSGEMTALPSPLAGGLRVWLAVN